MPTYHYRCKNCNYDFTEQQSFTDDPITVCPECGEEQVRKVYSAVPIEFKGSGFYRPDGIRHAAMRTRSHRHAAYCGRGAECRQRHGHHTRRRGVT